MTIALMHSGRIVDLEAPSPGDVSLGDIAHHLARVGRFTGAGDSFLSVAQHCILVSAICPPDLAPWALLHDASEAYIGDQSSPLKALLRKHTTALDNVEERWHHAISERFGVPRLDVKWWDIQAMLTERRDNGPRGMTDVEFCAMLGRDTLPEPYSTYVRPITSTLAEQWYLNRAANLGIA
jgi:hypothetical protein